MAPATLICDLDGTLWDSWPWYATLAGSRQAERILKDLRQGRSAAALLRAVGLSGASFESACKRRIEELPLYPGVHRAIADLVRAGCKLAVATNLPGWMVEPMLECRGLRDSFRTVV